VKISLDHTLHQKQSQPFLWSIFSLLRENTGRKLPMYGAIGSVLCWCTSTIIPLVSNRKKYVKPRRMHLDEFYKNHSIVRPGCIPSCSDMLVQEIRYSWLA
jgi:hypothetical protein